VKQVFDEVRNCWVAATAEEVVRQRWIAQLVKVLNYPKAFLVVEKEIKELPHLQHTGLQFPLRRVDLLSYTQAIKPLLLMEFKTEPLSEKMVSQALSYNTFVKAKAVAVANGQAIFLQMGGKILSHLPTFEELLNG
jgi:type I restriction and modification enzyme subunit R-like protein